MSTSIPEPPELKKLPATAHEQGSEIPLGWKPTAAEPVPVVRCVQIKKDGDRCRNWSLRGYHKCRKHAGPGALMPDGNVNKYREAVQEAARLRLLDSTDIAIDVLEDLMQPGTGEAIRLKSAESILDRAGIRGGFEIQVEGDITASPADELKKRLAELQKGATAVQRIKSGSEPQADDIVDADIVDDPDQPGLFELESDDDN